MIEEFSKPTRRTFLAAVGSAAVLAAGGCGSHVQSSAALPLHERKSPPPFALAWSMQSSTVTKLTGDALSHPAADTTGWYTVTLPSTVLAGLVAAGEYPDIF